MSTRFVINPMAERDIEDAMRWYEQQQPGSSQAFHADLSKAFERIVDAAGTHERVSGDSQRILLSRFPFTIYYRMEAELAVVMSILHYSRDPKELERRLLG